MSMAKTWPKVGEISDRFGNKFHIGNAGDFWMPPFPIGEDSDYRTHVRRIRDMEIRDDDVMIISPMKTGMHWHHDIIMMLRANDSKYIGERNATTDFLDILPMEVFDKMASPRILNTHMPFRYFPKQAFQKKVKIVFLDRNPKDAMVSFYCMFHAFNGVMNYPGTFEEFFRLQMDIGYYYGAMFDFLMDWQEGMEAHPDVPFYTSVYEDMIQNPVQGVLNLNNFLGTGCSQELCAEIAEACSFKKLKTFRDSTMPEHLKGMFKEGKPRFYRKGEVGDWKNWFTVSMNDEYEVEYKKRMSGYKRQYKYTLD